MAHRTLTHTSFTPTGTADTTALLDNTYLALKGGSGTQRVRIEEIYMGGQAGASSVNAVVLGRDSTVGGTPILASGALDDILDASAVALATTAIPFNSATTDPQRSATLRLLNLSFNSFGGIVRWVVSPPAYGPTSLGNTASLGEMSLSCFNIGTAGAMGAHILYEPF